ncbi:hypothetical protein HBA_0192 [Sodalis endosymbiont of Henestaris halophilus]|nr:hypothetical protein HBA_0192 [Sodalis endosymbiont of Henestaris halophilus]
MIIDILAIYEVVYRLKIMRRSVRVLLLLRYMVLRKSISLNSERITLCVS